MRCLRSVAEYRRPYYCPPSSQYRRLRSHQLSPCGAHSPYPLLPPEFRPFLGSSNSAAVRRVCCAASASGLSPQHGNSSETTESESKSVWARWQSNAAEMRSRVAKLGLAAILAYGLFDGVTYTTFFVLAFLGYEKSTGKNPAANIQALLGIVILMWTGNNVTRPLRVAGAAALAPAMDKALQKIQRALGLPSQVFSFMVVVASFAALCLSVVGLLLLSRCSK